MRKNRHSRIKKQTSSFLTDHLRIPPDVSFGESRITIAGDGWIWVEHYKGILEYTGNSLILQGKSGRIYVEGTGLSMDYYTSEDLVVRGKIRAVRYDAGKDA